MKTRQQWMDELPEDIQTRIKNNIEGSVAGSIPDFWEMTNESISEFIMGVFVWEHTDEGHEWWWKIWLKYAEEDIKKHELN